MVENIYSPGPQPLMALGLPRSEAEAKAKPLYPMNYYECAFCGHVFNADFDYAKVPYEDDSNLMFNKGSGWRDHIEAMARLLSRHMEGRGDATVIDIGAGDGDFLVMLREIYSQTRGPRLLAFEPGIEAQTCRDKGLETVADYFVPQRDIPMSKPTHLACRHVLEHLQEPRDFVAEIAYYANKNGRRQIMFAEVPCITKGLRDRRIGDFLYEHVGNFTQRSLQVMFESAGWRTYSTGLAYNDEVVTWIGDTRGAGGVPEPTHAEAFRKDVWKTHANVMATLTSLRQDGFWTAYWGGTGKGAAFLNAYQITGGIVVDSDPNKVGLFVPGTGQEIRLSDWLVKNPVHTIIITTRWRAADIYAEIQAKGIRYEQLLVLDGSDLRQYTKEDYEQEA
jgi:hypothetical protein